jgi:acetoin utilization deacetylase AcuC-like enzyme
VVNIITRTSHYESFTVSGTGSILNVSLFTRPQESPERVNVIMAKVLSPRLFDQVHEVAVSTDFPAASFEDVGRCHTQEYISFLQELAQEVSSTGDAVPFTPQVQRRAPCL